MALSELEGQMLEVIRRVEWSWDGASINLARQAYGEVFCPVCTMAKPAHAANCELAWCIAAAEAVVHAGKVPVHAGIPERLGVCPECGAEASYIGAVAGVRGHPSSWHMWEE